MLDTAERRIPRSPRWGANADTTDQAQAMQETLAETDRRVALANAKAVDPRVVVTGWRDLDRVLIGFHPGELGAVAGRPGEGKSVVAVHLAQRAAEAGQGVFFVALEQSRNQLVYRQPARRAGSTAGGSARGCSCATSGRCA